MAAKVGKVLLERHDIFAESDWQDWSVSLGWRRPPSLRRRAPRGETRKLVLRFSVPAMAALGLAQIAELALTYVELPSLDSHTVTVPVAVNVVPGDEAASRISNPTVQTELAFQQAQQAKRDADAALRRGDTTGAARMLADAGAALTDALACAPPEQAAELSTEAATLADLADRATWDDPNRVSKANYASWHSTTRKRGRPRPS